MDLDDYKKAEALRHRIFAESKRYLNVPVEKWPPIVFNWDLKGASQRFSVDPPGQATFAENFPSGFCLGWVDLPAFHKTLGNWSRGYDRDIWEARSPDTLALLIVYLSEGHPISPPLAEPLESREIILKGGNHRYAIAQALREVQLPIHVDPRHKEELSRIVRVQWIGR